jgi:hypothetical protein
VTGAYTGDLTCANSPASVGPNVGTTTIVPSVSGTGLSNFDITPVNGSYTINKASSTTTVSCPTSVTYTGSAQTPCSASVTGAGGLNQSLTVAYSNNINPGTNTATASAIYAGDANHNGSNDNKNFSILYSTGMCYGAPGHQILQPINTDGTSVFKKGSTVPAKFRVCDAFGNSIGTPGVVVSFKLVAVNSDPGAVVNEDPISTTPDTIFRWSSTDQQWIFNLNTKNLSAGSKYTYEIILNDGSKISFSFALK